MVEYLIENGADLGRETHAEKQTAMHYAAKNNASQSLKVIFMQYLLYIFYRIIYGILIVSKCLRSSKWLQPDFDYSDPQDNLKVNVKARLHFSHY